MAEAEEPLAATLVAVGVTEAPAAMPAMAAAVVAIIQKSRVTTKAELAAMLVSVAVTLVRLAKAIRAVETVAATYKRRVTAKAVAEAAVTTTAKVAEEEAAGAITPKKRVTARAVVATMAKGAEVVATMVKRRVMEKAVEVVVVAVMAAAIARIRLGGVARTTRPTFKRYNML
jgi:hypothetical protein